MEKLTKVCARCSLDITGRVATLDQRSYHVDCFVCHQCREPLRGKPVHIHEGKNYDEECYNLFHALKCNMCYGPILTESKFTRCEGKAYHRDCYSCYFCKNSLIGMHYIRNGEKRICKLCRDGRKQHNDTDTMEKPLKLSIR